MNDSSMAQLLNNTFKIIDNIRGLHSTNETKTILLKFVFYAYLSQKQTDYKNNISSSSKDVQNVLGYSIIPLKKLRNGLAHALPNNINLNEAIIYFNNHTSNSYKNIFHIVGPRNIPWAIQMLTITYDFTSQLSTEDYGSFFQHLLSYFANRNRNYQNYNYTPYSVSKLLANLTMTNNKKDHLNIYDPTMGTASTLVAIYNIDQSISSIYGQELKTETATIARINLLIHGINPTRIHVSNSDSLKSIYPKNAENKFDAVASVPPFSERWNGTLQKNFDPRFQNYGIAPKTKADNAFLLDGLYHLNDTGTMAILLPTGVLFRGSRDAKIRKQLILHNNIDAIIELPGNILYTTSIPTVIIILKKHRKSTNVLFINANNMYTKKNNQKIFSDKDINHIINLYKDKDNITKNKNKHEYHIATAQEIAGNNYNLNIPRYIDMSHPKPLVNLTEVKNKLNQVNSDINTSTKELHKLESKFDIK